MMPANKTLEPASKADGRQTAVVHLSPSLALLILAWIVSGKPVLTLVLGDEGLAWIVYGVTSLLLAVLVVLGRKAQRAAQEAHAAGERCSGTRGSRSKTLAGMAPEFRPGFRLSTLDVLVLVAGAQGAIAACRVAVEFAVLVAAATLHFFLFCNVFRVARPLELAWTALFLACVLAQLTLGVPWLVVAGVVAAMTTAVIWREMRKPSYHGVVWQRINPDLPAWWSSQHR